MTISPSFFDWQNSGINWDAVPHEACSPNLLAIKSWLDARYVEGTYLGCHMDRDIRDGGSPSEHSWGAAMDWSYQPGLREATANLLISISKELGIVAIHDYVACRIWRAGRTSNINDAYTTWWRQQTPNTGNGMGQSWATYFHIVTSKDKFADTTPIVTRLAPLENTVINFEQLPVHKRIFNSKLTPERRTAANPQGFVLPGDPIFMKVDPSVTNGRQADGVFVELVAFEFQGGGFLTLTDPNAVDSSVVNFAGDGYAIGNLVSAKLTNGFFTIYTSTPTHVHVDVQAFTWKSA